VLDAFDEAFDDEAYLTFEEREDGYADGTLMVQQICEAHSEDYDEAKLPATRFVDASTRIGPGVDAGKGPDSR
jgi:hypothetical protein